MKSNYDKKQNWLIVVLFALSITLTASLTAKLVKRADDNDNQINEVKKDLLDIESLLSKKEAVVLYDSTKNTNESDRYWSSKYIAKTEVKKYTYIYLRYETFGQSGSTYYTNDMSTDSLVQVDMIDTSIEKGGYNTSSIINGNITVMLSITNGTGDNTDCYSFYIASSSINSSISQHGYIDAIFGIY